MRCTGREVRRLRGRVPSWGSRSKGCGTCCVSALVCLAAILAAAAVVSATTVPAKDLAALCREADVAFLGTVTEVHSHWTRDVPHRLETLVTFGEVIPLRGELDGTVTVRLPGGEADGIREQVAGLPSLRKGDRVILLLGGDNGPSPVVGFYQGFFRVIEGSEGPVVRSIAGPLPFAGGGGGVSAPQPALEAPLDVFLDALRDELARTHRQR